MQPPDITRVFKGPQNEFESEYYLNFVRMTKSLVEEFKK
jgi:hypothetical protein